MSPQSYSRNGGTQFDNSLDHLLDDLQSTVSRPLTNGNTTSNVYKESRVDKSSLKSPHLINATPVTDYSINDSYSYTDPDGTQHYKTVKTQHYHYNSKGGTELPPEKLRMQDNINQLDSLLDDLQQAKQSDSIMGVNVNNNSIQHQAEYHKSRTSSGKTIVERAVPSYAERTRSLERSENRSQTYHQNEGSYGDIKSLRTRTPSPTFTKKVNVQEYPVEVIETTNPDINPQVLAGLDPEILPSGNTKVTTTIKTYTYEIPGNVDPDQYIQKALQHSVNQYEGQQSNQSITTPSKSFVYTTKNYENASNASTLTRTGTRPVTPTSPHSDRKVIRETITTKNYHPDNKIYTDTDGKRTYIYNETVKTRDYKDFIPGSPSGRSTPNPVHQTGHVSRPHTPRNDTFQTREYHTETTTHRSSSRGPREDSPDRTSLPPVTTTIHKFDSMSNLNARQYPDVETFDPKHPPGNGNVSPVQQYPVQVYPEEPEVNITYKYRSTTNTTNKYNTERYDNEPILPRKFPTDEVEGPPKRLDDLMAQIGNEPPTNVYNSGWSAHERELQEQRKIDALKASQDYERKKREEPLSKNITGQPVYYPPEHQMFAQKEEAAWRAQGAMAKESGKYKYEAESKSKSKSSSGAAIVPVCLPLCCGLPCTII